MDDLYRNMIKVAPCDQVHFKCIGCGACCKQIKQQVPIEALDAYRIARYLRNHGEEIGCMHAFLEKYAEPILLDECGYFMYVLKTTGEDDACIFLDNNRCRIHAVNPRACRTYPFVVEPDENGNFEHYVSYERKHHFNGPVVHPKTWLKKTFSREDRLFLTCDYGQVKEVAKRLRTVPTNRLVSALVYFQYAKYEGFDLDQPFQSQYEKNMEKLLAYLGNMSNNSRLQ